MIGAIISHYRILAELGRGGMGVVFKAEDTMLDRLVALKFLPPHLTASEAEQSRFLQEAKAASALNHPNVCNIHSIGEHDGQTFIDMELVEGQTLRARIASEPIKLNDAIGYAIQIGEALHEAHSKGIVHRDIKCENIMINSRNQIKVMDFGLAKLKGSLKLTKTSSTVGTLAYMAPEQIQGAEVDARSDIFSFGVVLFEMLTGHMPFRGEHDAAMMYSILNEEPDLLTTYLPDANSELLHIINRALEKDPADRYQHVDEMVTELRRMRKMSDRVVKPGPMASSRSHQPVNVPAAPQIDPKRVIWIASAAIAVLASVAWFLFFNKAEARITSMAVLPFVNAGGDQSAEYLSDGFTESLINSLSKIPGIKMMSRNSAFRYKGKNIDPQVIGKELNVGALLLGRVTEHGDALNVSVELVKTSDNSHIWGEQYERNASGIIALQNEISRELSRQLGATLTGDQEKQITKNATENTQAYQFYLKGRFYLNKRTAEGFQKAVEMFQSAIDNDPAYALAYVGLADCYSLMAGYFVLPSSEAFAKTKAAANKAIELDNTLAEPHTNLAVIASDHDWSFDTAEREFKHSLELNPNNATTHQWYGEFLAAMGRKREGLVEVQKAIEIDPLAPILYTSSSWIHCSLGEYENALGDAHRALELDPKFPRAFIASMQPNMELGKDVEALKNALEALAASHDGTEYRSWLGYAYGRLGKRKEAEKILADLLEVSQKQFVAPVLIALVYTGLGDKDKAFQWLEKVYNSHSGDIVYLTLDPSWKLLRDDPRFAALARKVGLPQ